ncbi:hypothetical protein DdX_17274 [Ditylenchus destructor]|uniref:F-box domain-containing protein n=1 Tax=Ditylenchus destructor TaxID=166010 RepID=A0AAD4MS69_9BILA|nr:hypothetical protein DdX_17274 [Ditylenchus destructor]
MASLPNEIFYDMTNFLPNDDIIDLMLLSRNFNGLVAPRLRKIDQEMATMDQSVKSLFSPSALHPGSEYISEQNLKRIEPVGSKAKKRMKEVFEDKKELQDCLGNATLNTGMLDGLKKRMSLERFGDATFLRILKALFTTPKFLQDYNISLNISYICRLHIMQINAKYNYEIFIITFGARYGGANETRFGRVTKNVTGCVLL